MTRNWRFASRFLLFHLLSVLLTSYLTLVYAKARRAYLLTTDGPLPQWLQYLHWSANAMAAIRIGLLFALLLLPASLAGWWLAGRYFGRKPVGAAVEYAGKGLAAGAFSLLAFMLILWLGGMIAYAPYPLIGMPIGALMGWLIFVRFRPDLAAPRAAR